MVGVMLGDIADVTITSSPSQMGKNVSGGDGPQAGRR